MFQPKFKHKMLLLMLVIGVAFGVVSIAIATDYRPANPTMDYVPQNVGIYDTYYCNFKESDCRSCHGISTAIRHHGTEYAANGDCLFCHRDWPNVVPAERDCKVCHINNGEVGDFGYPHHNSDFADTSQCQQCHDPNIVSETNTAYVPNYEPSNITPTPYSCENCHWPSGSQPHEAATYSKSLGVWGPNPTRFETDWLTWTGWPIPTYYPDGTAEPAPIEANGLVDSFNSPPLSDLWHGADVEWANRSGITMATKPFRPAEGTHHEGVGLRKALVYPKCYNCHAPDPGSPSDWNVNNKRLIRYCENCHDIGTLHYGIPEHVTPDTIYTVGGKLNQAVTANEKCVACHGDVLSTWPDEPAKKVKFSLQPNFGSKGIRVDLVANDTPGACGGEDCTFGIQCGDDKVEIRCDTTVGGNTCGDGDWHILSKDWSPNVVTTPVEGYNVWAGNKHWIQVVKDCLGDPNSPDWTSQEKAFNVMAHPKMNALTHPTLPGLVPSVGDWGSTITINGKGFGVQAENLEQPPYGYSSYVELHGSSDTYRVVGTGVVSWTDTQISVKLDAGTLLDVATGNPVPNAQELYAGCWQVKVRTDYFKKGGTGKYNLGINGLNPLHERIFYEESEPLCFTVTKDPNINGVAPTPVLGSVSKLLKNPATITGVNFGVTRGSSVIRVAAPKNHSNYTDTKAKVLSWSNTEIKFWIKYAVYPKTKDIQIVLNPGTAQEKKSNWFRITVVAP